MKKGLSLPINLIVILAIAILVMVVVAAMFVMYTGQAGSSLSDSTAWATGCQTAKINGCRTEDFGTTSTSLIKGYDPNGDKVNDNLYTACNNFFKKTTTAAECRTACCG